jgi:hypothetical protein
VAVSVVPREQSGMASGINDTFRQVGIAVGIAVWGAILVGRGADEVDALTASGGASPDRPRELMEAASSGNLEQALDAVPPQARETLSDAARQGFLTGLNEVLTLAALIAFIGAALALWLVREGEIDRESSASDMASEPARA